MKTSEQLTRIYDKYIDSIYRFVFFKVSSQATAEDLTSETFTRVFEHIRSSRSGIDEIGNMRAFLYRTARNIVIDHYRRSGRASTVPLEYEGQELVARTAANRDLPDEQFAQVELAGHIQDALSKLPGEQADMVAWYYIEDMPISDIAAIVERPEGTVRVMLHRALKELRSHMGDSGGYRV